MKIIKLGGKRGENKFILADDEDFFRFGLLKWSLDSNGYARHVVSMPDGKPHVMYFHRHVIGAGKGELVDHINGEPLDCRKSNLRKCSKAQNHWNSKKPKNNTSGYKNIFFTKNGIRVAASRNGKNYSLSAKTLEEAVALRDVLVKELHGAFTRFV